jgi:plasmid maintenance system antidote protein VapI
VALGETAHKTAKLFEPQASFWLSRNELYSISDQDNAATARRRHRRRINDTLRMPTKQPTKAVLELKWN